MINTALIGFGMSGKTIHFPLLHAHKAFDLKTVVSRSEDTQAYLKEKGSHASVLREFDDVLKDDSVDLVVLSIPNHLHKAFTEKAILAGKHVVVEKPFVKSYWEAKKLFDLAKKHGVVLRVFHNRKFDGDFMSVKTLLEEKRLGDVLSLSARFDRFRVTPKDGWRTEEGYMSGVFFDLGPHLFHYAISLFGLPNTVICDLMSDHRELKTDDHFEATLYYDTLRVALGAEQFARHPMPKFHIKGLKASYVKKGFDSPEFVYEPLKEAYQDNLYSMLVDNDLDQHDVPVKTGAHYQWYTELEDDITNNRLETKESIISLNVIKTMEAALKNHEQKKNISS